MVKNSEFTKIFFRFLKEYDKTSYTAFYKLFNTCRYSMGSNDNEETLYTMYQKYPSIFMHKVRTPRDIVLAAYESSNSHDKDRLWDKQMSDVDRKWMDFYRKGRIRSKFFRHPTSEEKKKYSINGLTFSFIEKEGTC